MNKILFIFLFLIFPICSIEKRVLFLDKTTRDNLDQAVNAEWTIVGGGPAGITVIGLLLDAGVDPSSIIWIDPEFNVGRIGKYYSTVPANSLTKNFIAYINACKEFSTYQSEAIQHLKECDPEKECVLDLIVRPLQDITNILRNKILSLEDHVEQLNFNNNIWNIHTHNCCFKSNHVVLATGCRPRTLNYIKDKEIQLDVALTKEELAKQIEKNDTIAVVGDKHSAMLILKFLSELPIARIMNFYRSKPIYWTDPGAENSGLSGIAAEWAKEVYEQNPPHNLLKIFSCDETLTLWTALCTKIIYAVGYERNPLPSINGQTTISYDDTTGIVMPRLFGIGIAFPEQYIASNGNIEHKVGLREFSEYAQKVIPLWMQQKKDSVRHLLPFDRLFNISYVCLQRK
ncbi:hypothetical protein KC460_04010 [Candidatus Dependentiae bacterium]|nr:hypothetical protein [Candidatus Dependentiae bacterium]